MSLYHLVRVPLLASVVGLRCHFVVAAHQLAYFLNGRMHFDDAITSGIPCTHHPIVQPSLPSQRTVSVKTKFVVVREALVQPVKITSSKFSSAEASLTQLTRRKRTIERVYLKSCGG